MTHVSPQKQRCGGATASLHHTSVFEGKQKRDGGKKKFMGNIERNLAILT